MSEHSPFAFCMAMVPLILIAIAPIPLSWANKPAPPALARNLPGNTVAEWDREFARRVASRVKIGKHVHALDMEFSQGGLTGFKRDVWGHPPDAPSGKYYELANSYRLPGGRAGCATYAEVYWNTDKDGNLAELDTWVGERDCFVREKA